MKFNTVLFAISGTFLLLSMNITQVTACPSAGIQGPTSSPGVLMMGWHNRPANLPQAVAQAGVIVRARVTGVQAGPDIITNNCIPTQRVSFQVLDTFKGNAGSSFKLFRTGGPNVLVHEDAVYQSGQDYVLLMTKRNDGSYLLVGPDGRFEVDADDLLESSADEGFAKGYSGADVQDLLDDIEGEL